jgi:uncharacterized small protein (DUF1192 family)
MGRLKTKGKLKKAIAIVKPKTAPKVAKPGPAPTKPKNHERKLKAMSVEIKELEEHIATLTDENTRLKELNANQAQQIDQLNGSKQIRWTRGKLPGEKLIKSDPDTGAWMEISREEWDSLA